MSQDPYTPGPGENPYEPRPGGSPYPDTGPGGNPYGQGPYGGPEREHYQTRQTPLPLGEAIQQLPNQYIKVLTKPGAPVIAEELGKASWDIIWVQLVLIAIVSALAGYVSTLISPGGMMMPGVDPRMVGPMMAGGLGIALGLLILNVAGFFISVGLVFLFAKMFGGQGTFLRQGYATLLWRTPITILSSIAGMIPILGFIVTIGLGIYGIVLNVFTVMAVHRLSGGKATAAVLLPVAILIVLGCAIVFAVGAMLLSMYQQIPQPPVPPSP